MTLKINIKPKPVMLSLAKHNRSKHNLNAYHVSLQQAQTDSSIACR